MPLSSSSTTAGFEVVAYSSAEELLESTDAKDLDCVVADIYLPRMNGLSFRRNSTAPFIRIDRFHHRPWRSVTRNACDEAGRCGFPRKAG